MSRLPVISGAVCIKALAKMDFVIDRQRGSHFILGEGAEEISQTEATQGFLAGECPGDYGSRCLGG